MLSPRSEGEKLILSAGSAPCRGGALGSARFEECHERYQEHKMKLIARALAIVGAVAGCSVHGLAQQPPIQEPDIGRLEYEASCAACHGADGKGTGPVGIVLLTKPADLTTIAKRNNGVFPIARVYEVIDGRQEVKAHGDRAMPVWGHRYSFAPVPKPSQMTPQIVDPLYNREPLIRAHILAVIDYLYRIQEK
jgi:mono/diheme cytochrome c family protein